MIMTQHTLWERNQFFIKDEEEFYNLCLSVDILLHNYNILSPKAPTFSLYAHPTGLGQNINATT